MNNPRSPHTVAPSLYDTLVLYSWFLYIKVKSHFVQEEIVSLVSPVVNVEDVMALASAFDAVVALEQCLYWPAQPAAGMLASASKRAYTRTTSP